VALDPAARIDQEREAGGMALWETVFAEAVYLLEYALRELLVPCPLLVMPIVEPINFSFSLNVYIKPHRLCENQTQQG
jgi:hypothetical protein